MKKTKRKSKQAARAVPVRAVPVIRQTELVSVENLELDSENPRLAIDGKIPPLELLRRLYVEEALDELAYSFIKNGYFGEEPLVAVRTAKSSVFTVVEGNRRLATLKLLLNPSLRKQIQVSNSFPELPNGRKSTLDPVPVIIYESRDEVIPYLGFRHVTGAKKWEPYSKARYVAQLIAKGYSIADVEAAVGDTSRAVRKLYQAYVISNQVETDLSMGAGPLRDEFSLLEVTLGQQSIKEFLGIPRELPSAKSNQIVSTGRLEKLRELIGWVFGDPERELRAVVSDSRQISQRLAPVIADSAALERLRTTRDLEAAYEFAGGESEFLRKQLGRALRCAQQALGVLPNFRGDASVTAEIERLRTVVEEMVRAVRK
jgi:hypothetical protein